MAVELWKWTDKIAVSPSIIGKAWNYMAVIVQIVGFRHIEIFQVKGGE